MKLFQFLIKQWFITLLNCAVKFAVAGVTTQQSGQAHVPTVYYQRMGLDTLVPKFRFYSVAEKFPLPQNNGKTVQMWRDAVPGGTGNAATGTPSTGYNINAASEGVTLATPFVNVTATITATLEAISDFSSTSVMMEDVSIADEVGRMIRALSIRASGSVDLLIRNEIDSNTGTTVTIGTIGTNMAAADFKKGGALLEGANVNPWDGTRWLAVI